MAPDEKSEKDSSSIRSDWRSSAIEYCKKNGFIYAANAAWLGGIGTLMGAKEFGGTVYDTASGYINLAAIGLSLLLANKVYSFTAALSVLAIGVQQFPNLYHRDALTIADFALVVVGTTPAVAETWLRPKGKKYIEDWKAAGRKLTAKTIPKLASAWACAEDRKFGSTTQSLSLIPFSISAYATHDSPLLAALALFITGNVLDGLSRPEGQKLNAKTSYAP